jgi:hypothetical protein
MPDFIQWESGFACPWQRNDDIPASLTLIYSLFDTGVNSVKRGVN